jgi:integrase
MAMGKDGAALPALTKAGGILPRPDGEAPISATLTAATRSYRAQARGENTVIAYRHAWHRFTAWCEQESRDALPASIETVAAWMAALADGQDGRALSQSTVNVHLSAVVSAHRAAGHSFDRKHPLIAETWAGISRAKAKTHEKRQARPIMADDLRELLSSLSPKLLADARDAALLALGWAAALRRSELVGLDWGKRSTGAGSVMIEEGRGLVVALPTSKGSQTEGVSVVIPCEDMPIACEALERWAQAAKLAPGDPVFRSIDKGQRLRPGRLAGRSVARIVKARIRELAQARGKTREEAEELVQQFSGHSMRAGYATTAGAADMASYRIMQHTRHKSHEQVAGYIREGQKWTKSGLKGIGF